MAINRGFAIPQQQQITTYDPEQIGGGQTTRQYNSDGTQQLISGGHSDQDVVDRYRSLGAAAAGRSAYQANWAPATADEANGTADRQSQLAATGLLQQAAQGNAPSAAAIQGAQVGGQSLAGMLGASAGARAYASKGGLGAAAAQQQALAGMGGQQLGAAQQYEAMRGNEMAQAQGAYGAAGTSLRSGDVTQQGLAAQRAQTDAASQFAQNQLNDQAQQQYEQMGINSQQAQVNADLRRDQMQTNSNETANAKYDADQQRNLQMGVGMMQAVGGLAASDERAKTNVKPADRKAASGSVERAEPNEIQLPAPSRLEDLGQRLHRGTYDALSDAMGRLYEVSDERAKEGMRGERDMGHDLAEGLRPFEYEYKPGFDQAERQAPGEKNVGPMAQNMASNPTTGTAVKQMPGGLLVIDQPKALKMTMGGLGHLAAEQERMKSELARMKGGR